MKTSHIWHTNKTKIRYYILCYYNKAFLYRIIHQDFFKLGHYLPQKSYFKNLILTVRWKIYDFQKMEMGSFVISNPSSQNHFDFLFTLEHKMRHLETVHVSRMGTRASKGTQKYHKSDSYDLCAIVQVSKSYGFRRLKSIAHDINHFYGTSVSFWSLKAPFLVIAIKRVTTFFRNSPFEI